MASEMLRLLVPKEIESQTQQLSDADLAAAYNNLLFASGKSSAQATRLQSLQNELAARGIKTQQQTNQAATQDILNALGGGGQVGGQVAGPQFNINELIAQEQQSLGKQKQSLADIFRQQAEQGTRELEERFAPLRSKQIAEEAALGRLTSPASIASVGRIDERQATALSDLLGGLSSQEAQAEVGLESDAARRLQQAREFAANLGLSEQQLSERQKEFLANMLQGQYQFGQQQNLAQQKFGEEKRQFDLARQQQDEANALAMQLGQAQAQASRPSGLQEAMGIVGGIGSLAGGLGGLIGGRGGGGMEPGVLDKIGSTAQAARGGSQLYNAFNPPKQSLIAQTGYTPRNFSSYFRRPSSYQS